jgi:hypothetical protein
LKIVTSGLLRALKTLSPPEFIRLRGRIKAANKDVLPSALDRYIRDGGPEPDVTEDLPAHRWPRHKKTVNHGLAVFE